jgi:hypothetical protein
MGASTPQPSRWAMGGLVFAAAIMVLTGALQFAGALVAILDDQFFTVRRNYPFDLDVTTWGWIHLVVGALVFVAGIGLFSRSVWAGYVAIFLAAASAVVSFLFIPYYPFWTIVVVALDIFVIWALTRPAVIQT